LQAGGKRPGRRVEREDLKFECRARGVVKLSKRSGMALFSRVLVLRATYAVPTESASQILFRPAGAYSHSTLPTACAVGCILTPLRGSLRPHPFAWYLVLTHTL
jgi:hypothetical protein